MAAAVHPELFNIGGSAGGVDQCVDRARPRSDNDVGIRAGFVQCPHEAALKRSPPAGAGQNPRHFGRGRFVESVGLALTAGAAFSHRRPTP